MLLHVPTSYGNYTYCTKLNFLFLELCYRLEQRAALLLSDMEVFFFVSDLTSHKSKFSFLLGLSLANG